jgi:hypothetical protein
MSDFFCGIERSYSAIPTARQVGLGGVMKNAFCNFNLGINTGSCF